MDWVLDIAHSAYSQLRSVQELEDHSDDDSEDGQPTARQPTARMLRLQLSDGVFPITAAELTTVRGIDTNSPPGLKVAFCCLQ